MFKKILFAMSFYLAAGSLISHHEPWEPIRKLVQTQDADAATAYIEFGYDFIMPNIIFYDDVDKNTGGYLGNVHGACDQCPRSYYDAYGNRYDWEYDPRYGRIPIQRNRSRY